MMVISNRCKLEIEAESVTTREQIICMDSINTKIDKDIDNKTREVIKQAKVLLIL